MPHLSDEADFQRRERVESVVPVEGRKVHIVWRGGLDEIVDLKPLLVRFPMRPVAARDLVFRTVKVGKDGSSLVWDDGSEIALFWLQDLALAHMKNQEFCDALGKLNFTIEEAAAHLGLSTRSIAGYRRDRDIPRAAAFAVRFLLRRRAQRR